MCSSGHLVPTPCLPIFWITSSPVFIYSFESPSPDRTLSLGCSGAA
jgi:hypothetical protein